MYIKQIRGLYLTNSDGFGFVRPFPSYDVNVADNIDIFIPPLRVNGALNGDVVICNAKEAANVRTVEGDDKSSISAVCSSYRFQRVGQIVSVEKRMKNFVSGEISNSGKKKYLIPDNYITYRMLLTGDTAQFNDGEKVLARLYPRRAGNIKAGVEKLLGGRDEFVANYNAIVLSSEVDDKFSKDSLTQALDIEETPITKELPHRTDFRGKAIFTINDHTSSEYNCAFSVERNENGNFVLGVHTPDVAHYVERNSPLDLDARKRGQTVNFTGKVFNIFPERLLESKFTLSAGKDALALSYMLTIDNTGNVINFEMLESVINVSVNCEATELEALFIDSDASAILDIRNRYRAVTPLFNDAFQLGAILQRTFKERGGAFVDRKKRRFVFVDHDHKPINVKQSKDGDPTRLVNEFISAAGMAIAEFFFSHDIPAYYAGCNLPSRPVLEQIASYARNLGVSAPDIDSPDFLYRICENALGSRNEDIVFEKLAYNLRNTHYSFRPISYCTLATDKNVLFSKPASSYYDLITMRIVKMVIAGNGSINEETRQELMSTLPGDLEECICNSVRLFNSESSASELFAADFFKKNIGRVYEGTIGALSESSVLVLIDNGCFGSVHYIDYDSAAYSASKYTVALDGKEYKLGQRVSVRVQAVSLSAHSVRLKFAE